MSNLGEILEQGKEGMDDEVHNSLVRLQDDFALNGKVVALAASIEKYIEAHHGLRVTVNFAYVQCDFANEDVDYASVEIWRKSDDGESELLYECDEVPFDEDAAQKIDDACRNYLVNIRSEKG